ncbi:probable E3 SUMO-protein ligase RNF212 isoform X2 [Dasypus novemcinctus]|uniref:probable E3 SUMO-protein ligase RNF212 isoform X2 n=1 Tax=Dasypus novemcinctus TaxID=9361 RepID=UPI000328F7C8|nr:probable E3 SUMO-protein ligase RNF212 isoform X2 [Dasypus novemcinctus]
MASWVFCNRCFRPPCRTSLFSLTSCGHVYCDDCLGKGEKNECLICKVPCRTVLLSKHTDSDIQAFFMGIDGLCKKYSRETSQILRLEESLRRSVLQKDHLHRLESMEVDLTPSPVRKPDTAAGPTRISLISPPQDGRMGSVCSRGPQLLGRTPGQASTPETLRFPSLQVPCKGLPQIPTCQVPGRAARADASSPRGSQPTLHPQAPGARQPISISGLLQRQLLGSARLGALSQERGTLLPPPLAARPSPTTSRTSERKCDYMVSP